MIYSIEPQFRTAAMAYRTGRIQEAENLLRGLLKQSSDHIESHFVLGMLLGRTGRWEEAISHLEPVLVAQPTRHEALYWVAVAKKMLGAPEAAASLFEKALIADPQNPIVLNELGLCRMALNQVEPALQAFVKATGSDPTGPAYYYNAGIAYKRLDQFYKARDAFQDAIRLEPRGIEAYLELKMVLEVLNLPQDALAVLSNAVEVFPGEARLLTALAAAKSQVGARKEAEEIYRSTMAAHPASGIAFAEWLQQEGRFEESVKCILTSLKAVPFQGVAFYRLAEAKAFKIDGKSWIGQAEPLVESPILDLKEKTYLCYALARAYEQSGDAEKTIHFYDLANSSAFALYNKGRPFNRRELSILNDQIISHYSAKAVRTPLKGASDSGKPIFIVGMIRSGTTLLDQVLSSHPEIKSAGEPVFWIKESDRIHKMNTQELSREAVSEIAGQYLSAIETAAGQSKYISDKMPLNYFHVGLIHRIFPNAKIIHLRRNPLDTCFSIYSTFFGQGPAFAYNQANIVFNYIEYQKMMRHWTAAIPTGTILDVDYESLVEDRENTARRVLDFCGIEWNDACLAHEKNESSILTPSKWQARQPIYRSSIQRWLPYEPWLKELKELKAICS